MAGAVSTGGGGGKPCIAMACGKHASAVACPCTGQDFTEKAKLSIEKAEMMSIPCCCFSFPFCRVFCNAREGIVTKNRMKDKIFHLSSKNNFQGYPTRT